MTPSTRLVKSCGAVVFTHAGGENLYVIIRQTNGDCGFPKGRMESGECEQATALREIYEEVGLRPSLVDGFRMEVNYPFPNTPHVTKQVVYFLAEYSNQKIRPQIEELSEAYLLPYEASLHTLTFSETRQILAQADHFLRKCN